MLQATQLYPTKAVRYYGNLTVVERIPTKRARATTTRLEPLKQARSMKQVLTGAAPLIRQLPIASHNAVADRTLGLSPHRTIHITLKRCQRINQAAIEDRYGSE